MTTITEIHLPTTEKTKNSKQVIKEKTTEAWFNNYQQDSDKAHKIQQAKDEMMAKIHSKLGLDPADESFKAEIINENGKYYLKLTRVKEDGTNYKLGDIKNKLSIADDVIANNNDLKEITGRPNLYKSDSATIEPNKFIIIPVDDIGTTRHKTWDSWFPGELRESVEIYLKEIK